jgi:large subunit ribosomal protein L23
MIRTPNLPPKYASFWVPLRFNKLDFKNYLKNVYNVDVVHIRSYVQQQKPKNEEVPQRTSPTQSKGRLYRPTAKKKMTVELVDPFVYPEEEKDMSAYVYSDNIPFFQFPSLCDVC